MPAGNSSRDDISETSSTASTSFDNTGTRLRRAKSTTTLDDVKHRGEVKRRKRPDKPIHRAADSLFSWSSGFKNFEGFVNWGFLLLFLGGSRLFLENIIKYGVRIDPFQWVYFLIGDQPTYYIPMSLILLLYANVHILMALLIEKGLAGHYLSPRHGLTAQVTNLLLLLLTPIAIFNTWNTEVFSLFGATFVCFAYSILFLKLWSYCQVNGWCRSYHSLRRRRNSGSQSTSPSMVGAHQNTIFGKGDPFEQLEADPNETLYPENLSIKDLYYFVMVPTLCYELNFPRTDRVRKRFLLRRMLELFFGMQLVLALFQQWIIPSVKNSLMPFSNMDVIKTQERLLKLAIPNHLIWLIWFYLFFHCYLNILGELLRFADRDFYQDWWNAPDIDTFWRTWNSPVHRWAVRHLYIPIIKQTNSKFFAVSTTFFISAFFHEYLVSVPLRTYKIWAFGGMMAQLPLSALCKFVVGQNGERKRWGNVVVWASLILGQPLCIMMYYHDYIITHFGQDFLQSFTKI
ncbi:diacylglycerol O-acyltransferase 1 [Folsomia candida]|uniref:diacylglycerol O-acyltransferase 1 n=1 Tax=Folsomia candida TaxID=158441 RepID=UPI000B909DCF|nr:diacylglycerol O-acyltransferase 1 [Folsomia candida]